MLLLVTIGLVLVGAVSLVIGFVSNSLAPIYLSIACSVIAGIVLVVFSRMSKRQEAGGPSLSGFTPAPSSGAWTPPPPAPPPPAPPTPVPSYRAPVADAASEPSPVSSAVAVEDFPIEGYDTLRVSQILPALDELDLDDLDDVREREEQGKNRTTVLRRIDVLMDDLEGEEAGGPAPEMDGDLVGDEGFEPEDDLVDDEEVDDDDVDDLDGELAADERDHTAVMATVGSAVDSFPIPGYDRLPVAQILPLLDDLDDDELDLVAEHEEQGKNRAAILDRIDDMFEPLDDEPPPPPPPPAPVPVKRAPVKKVAVKRAPAKKVAATKAPAKRPAVKAGAVKTAAVKKVAPTKRPSPVLPRATATKKAAAPAKRPAAATRKAAKKR